MYAANIAGKPFLPPKYYDNIKHTSPLFLLSHNQYSCLKIIRFLGCSHFTHSMRTHGIIYRKCILNATRERAKVTLHSDVYARIPEKVLSSALFLASVDCT